MNYKFNVGEKVLVVYANNKTKVGRVESVSEDITTAFNGRPSICPSYKVSIEGNKRFKKFFEFELKPIDELSSTDYKKLYNELNKQVKKFLDVNSDFNNFVVDHMLDLADEQQEEYSALCDKQDEEFHNLRALVV